MTFWFRRYDVQVWLKSGAVQSASAYRENLGGVWIKSAGDDLFFPWHEISRMVVKPKLRWQ